MSTKRNEFLDHGDSGDSDLDDGYDSEAAEAVKGGRGQAAGRSVKRRKLSHSDDEDGAARSTLNPDRARFNTENFSDDEDHDEQPDKTEQEDQEDSPAANSPKHTPSAIPTTTNSTSKSKKKGKPKEPTPGVIYLSSLPPYLKPSALRNLLTQRGFSPITRLFLTPASKSKSSSSSKKNSRQLYTEGWIEFGSRKTARRCAETLNAQIIGGRKGGFYHDDIWNMRYLRGMAWGELMAGIREEKREAEGRRDEERRTIAAETKRFVEGVEEGRRREGMKRKRSGKVDKGGGDGGAGAEDVKRTWRQFEVKGKPKSKSGVKKEKVSDDVQEVLGKIF